MREERWTGLGTGAARVVDVTAGADLMAVRTDEVAGTSLVVRVVGEVDLLTAPRLAEELAEASGKAGGRRVVADLSAVGFLGSAGLNVLMDAAGLCRRLGVGFALLDPHPRVRRAIEIAGLDAELTIASNLAAPPEGTHG